MRVLISNDDGYLAPGIARLAEVLQRHAEVLVCAPERDRSGASNSLTLDRPLTVRKGSNGFFYVNGTPTDCVHLAATGLMDTLPDLVFSGINQGANLGDDTIYSGTVAAASEGFLLGVPAVAISLAARNPQHWDTAASVAEQVFLRLQAQSFASPALLNVNVPDVPLSELQGWQVTRLGRRHKSAPVIRSTNPRGEEIWWVGPVGPQADAGEGTDFHAIEHGQVSLTPLSLDLSAQGRMQEVATWLYD